MLYILLLLCSYNISAMSDKQRQEQEILIKQKQLLLYNRNMAIAATNAAPLEKFLAQTYNNILFLTTLETNRLTTERLLQLTTIDPEQLSVDLYSPAIMSRYSTMHDQFNKMLITASLLKNKQDYTQEDANRQFQKVTTAISYISNETIRQWLNAYLTYHVTAPQKLEYIQAKATLTQLHNKYPTIIPKS